MRLAFLLSLSLGAVWCVAAPADPPKEDLRQIREVMRNRGPSLDTFEVVGKKVLNSAYSVLLVEAAPKAADAGAATHPPPFDQWVIGLFVVSDMQNRVRLVLDIFPARGTAGFPTLAEASVHAVYLDYVSDYGMYYGSTKYIYDLARARPPVKLRYHRVALTSSVRGDGEIVYHAISGAPGSAEGEDRVAYWKITIKPRGPDKVPKFSVADSPPFALPGNPLEPTPIRTADGESVRVVNRTPPGQTHRPSGIEVTERSGKKRFYPSPVPLRGVFGSKTPRKAAADDIEIDIGPWVADGPRIWFANTFYDAEGTSGVGAIGTFNIPSRKYTMRYLPAIAPWSGSAILLDGGTLWIGLMRRPEGSAIGGGLLGYAVRDGSTTRFPFADYVYTIDRIGDTIYCGASDGLYTLRGEELTHMRFEPDARGRLTLVAKALQQAR